MAEFDQARATLNALRTELASAQAELAGATQLRACLEQQLARAKRTSRKGAGEASDLARQLEEATAAENRKRAAVKALRAQLADGESQYTKVADPRVAIGAWDGETPILLFPVRLETRFRRVDDGAGGARDELWVRIFPDDCLIDTFEAALSETEVTSGTRYWTETWAAGGIESQRRAAWRNLVASHGAGRAAWIVKQYSPSNAEPAKAKEQDVRLVVVTSALPTQHEQDALDSYWTAVWLADGDKPKIDAAFATLLQTLTISSTDGASLTSTYTPTNLLAKPPSPYAKKDVVAHLAWLVLPEPANLKTRSWSAPPTVRALPDCFVVLGYQGGNIVFAERGRAISSPLVAGPDPSTASNDPLRFDAQGELIVPEDMRWLVEFDQAVDVGMGVRVPLDPTRVSLSDPIERVVALGLRLADDADGGRVTLEELLKNHRYGRAGCALLPQGTPTNNTDAAPGGYRRGEDADSAYDALFTPSAKLTPGKPWQLRQDGEWLADALGVDVGIFEGMPNASGRDFAEARALNRALWPATFGYTLETMMYPLLNREQADATRWFYSHFVTGRGFLPSLRINDQPYGVLPVSALSSRVWSGDDGFRPVGGIESPPALDAPQGFPGFMRGLARVLTAMRADWEQLVAAVSFVGKSGDAHQLLLNILGLHPASVEFHQRYAESLEHLFNSGKFLGVGAQILQSSDLRGVMETARRLLRDLGYRGDADPDALDKFFFTHANRLNGPLIDDRPLSESDSTRPYTANGKNYLAWLADRARTSFEDLRLERGFAKDEAPDALLYVILRQALLLAYWDAGLQLHLDGGAMSEGDVAEARREPTSFHVAGAHNKSESRYVPLYSTDARASGSTQRTVAERIAMLPANTPATRGLNDQIAALELLQDVPTARLERCLAEHLDTASYRLDAWLLGLVNIQLAGMRYQAAGGGLAAAGGLAAGGVSDHQGVETRRGIHLGAYGWLENLTRKTERLHPVQLPAPIEAAFGGNAPLMHDPSNGGFIAAPSIAHATTSAILRAGYLSNASAQQPQVLAVNLSSARVRIALDLLEGIRNGQPLGALLGYQLQRGLHEGHSPLELDRFIYPLRQQFPLVANQLASTRDASAAIETIEANNVIDGLKLLEHVRKTGYRSYPFGLSLPAATTEERDAINEEVAGLMDANDAIADIVLAEGVHQAGLGNYDRVAATLDASSKGSFPPDPDVVRTPRSGTTLTHRVGVHFEAGVDPATRVYTRIPASPRSQAQPMVNKWLASILPPPDEVACRVEWIDPIRRLHREQLVTQEDLELQPIDLLYIATLDGEQAMGELDDRIIQYVFETRLPRADAAPKVRHTERLAAPAKTFFELAPLLRHLRTVLLCSRPLTATDVSLTGDAAQSPNTSQSIALNRVQLVFDSLKLLSDDITSFDAQTVDIERACTTAVLLFQRAARHAIQQVGWGYLYEWRRKTFAGLISRLQTVDDRWTQRLADFDARMTTYRAAAPGMSDKERLSTLARLELFLAANPTSPRPATPAAYEDALDGAAYPASRRRAFDAQRVALEAVIDTSDILLSSLVSAVQARLPWTTFDSVEFSVDDVVQDIALFRSDLQARMTKLSQEIAKRLKLAKEKIDAAAAAASPAAAVAPLQAAATTLLGDDMELIPEFSFAPSQAAELANAYAASSSLTDYLKTVKQMDFPVDDWLHGIARVRDKLFSWEQAVALTGVLGGMEPALKPVQLPFRQGEGWLALEIDPVLAIDGERLLYTAHFAAAMDAAATTCGLLIDEWTEVIPARDETAGVAFHFDRPGSEPPQSWLLVTPPRASGAWQWTDVLGALEETFSLARLRAVEPTQVESRPYAQFLPATVSAAALYGISISANYSRVNGVAQHVRRKSDG
jgi:hypothetical protein